MIKYKEIIDAFKYFCDKHRQINTFYSGQEWDFQTEDNFYPAFIAIPQPSSITEGEIVLNFNIFICDIMHKEIINKVTDDIYSDMLLIVQDFVSFFNDNESFDFKLDTKNVTIEPFEEKIDDVLCGWSANININYRFGMSDCGLPMNIEY